MIKDQIKHWEFEKTQILVLTFMSFEFQLKVRDEC